MTDENKNPATDEDLWASAAQRDPLDCPCCAATAAVAPFVAWLRETRNLDMYMLILAQALSITALEQLAAHQLAGARWARLDLTKLLNAVRERCLPPPSAGELRSMGAYLLRFLALHGLLARKDWKRLRAKLRVVKLQRLEEPW